MPLQVTLGDGWKLYARDIPPGYDPLGVVTRAGVETHALLRHQATGLLVRLDSSSGRGLEQVAQREAHDALEAAEIRTWAAR